MKKILALLLVAVMAIGFCACAAKTETPAEPAATEETTTTEPAATEETTESPLLRIPRPPRISISTS